MRRKQVRKEKALSESAKIGTGPVWDVTYQYFELAGSILILRRLLTRGT